MKSINNDRNQGFRFLTPQALWALVLSLLVGFVALPGLTQSALAVGTASMSPSPTTAKVGTAKSQVETYTSTVVTDPLYIEVVSGSQFGLTLETLTATTALLSGTPSKPGTLFFTVVGYDNSTSDTATLEVDVTCPSKIDVDSATANVCLTTGTVVSLGDEGFSPTDTSTPISPHAADPHQIYNGQADSCAQCHRTHADSTQNLIRQNTLSRSVECMACHDGTGASTDVHTEYSETATGGAVNDPITRSFYTHDAVAVATGHIPAATDEDGSSYAVNEFGGVSNRHSDCVDCHNPHATALSPAAMQFIETGTARGWLISGALRSASAADPSRDLASAFIDYASTTTNFEYQLCLKCHSRFTMLGANIDGRPSLDYLDKSGEIDTDTAVNGSFHPITRAGTNQSETMTASLTGKSDFKLWKFAVTDTVRCSNCHAAGAKAEGPGQVLAPHSSPNRGILIAPYRDRNLLPETATVDLGRFALCFTCHTDVPFKSQTISGTNYRYHYVHIAEVNGGGTNSGSIDDPGAGKGHALCAECHFRLHSTKNAVAGQAIDGSRLVNFSPNVEPVNGVLKWTPRNGSTPGTCTLKCHGATHRGTAY